MVTIMNKLNQPLVINLDSGESIHLLARSTRTISFEDFQSPEIREKLSSNQIIVLEMKNE